MRSFFEDYFSIRIFIFLLSIIYCCLIQISENFIGINLNFHPDSLFYIERAENINWNQFKLRYIFYFYIKLLNIKELIIFINFVLYSITNIQIYDILIKKFNNKKLFYFLIIFFFIFNPLRAHYAAHILKETIIIFLLVLLITNRKKFISLFIIVIGFFFRPAFLIYSLIFIRSTKSKYFITLIITSIIFFIIQYREVILFVIFQTNGDMQFRSFDNIPNFLDLGIKGQIIRSIYWPFLISTGFFAIHSFNLYFLPIAFYNFFQLSICFYFAKKYQEFFLLFIILSIFAFIVSGFTSFIRYTLPIMTVLPLIIKIDPK